MIKVNKAKEYWDKIALIVIMSITGFLCFYAIGSEGYSNEYYASAVKSMLTSWQNFFFASFDPGGYVTVDKPAFGLWLQAASAFIFGFHGWSIILPEALSAVISVALIYYIVKRSFGKAAGITSAFVLGLTPILIAVSRTNNLDSSLVMLLLLATLVLIKAAEKSSLKLLLLSMAIVGLGFNIKMLQAFMVLPAFYLVYFFTAPSKAGKKIVHLVTATALLIVVSLSWAVVVDLIPADKRPYIGSSKSNSVLELALGYNGIQRVTGNQGMGGSNGPEMRNDSKNIDGQRVPQDGDLPSENNSNKNLRSMSDEGKAGFGGPPPSSFGPAGSPFPGVPSAPLFGGPGNGGPGGVGENGQKGILRIFNQQLSGQISWFLPMALFGILMLLLKALEKGILGKKAIIRHLILWTAWIVPMIGFFSIAGFFHRYYLSMLAPGIAALSGIGIVQMWKAYTERGWKWVLLPTALISDALVQYLILSRYKEWGGILIPIVCGICLISAAGLVLIIFLKKDNLARTIRIATAAGFAVLLITPAIWAYTPIIYGSQTVMPVAGPELKRGDASGKGMMNSPDENKDSSALINFLISKKHSEKYLVAVSDARSAESIILKTGEAVMAVGGFSGNDNILTVSKLESMVKNGEIRYFQLSGMGMGGQQSDITNWVMSHGKAVTIDDQSNSSTIDNGFDGRMNEGTLYDLAPEKG